MARRAQQGALARCPWCAASLPHLAAECPECRFPLTMAAAEGGFLADQTGTTSTATPFSLPRPSMVGPQPESELARAHGSRAHRLRVGAWLLGMLSVLLLLAGIGAAVSTSSSGARGDREATANLLTALQREKDPVHRQEVAIIPLPGDEPSDQPSRVSTARASGFWFAAARSASGRCFLLAGRLSDGVPLGRGTLNEKEPCSAARVRFHLEEKLVKSD
ncbi:MAG: hypothetical protein AVDCRST_MAG76-1589 [uncultured Acidimicrobiales bacterium]|uniref:Uncharacterized protein n=1 Tax=uncultured Acidimicrobiales bacterium TaxID=310071 RepID=A0A6J4HYK3_9ACTN|nr:MAG: hypothetical protein AVDCRST_MAG76-1589 [uncultured Acidimicrobiales bacterium]